MANSIDGVGGPGFLQPTAPLPVFGSIERAARTFAKAPFTLIGMSLIPIVPAIIVDGFALLGPENARALLKLVSLIVQSVVQFTVTAAIVVVTRNLVAGREREVGAALQRGTNRLLPLIGMSIVQFLSIMIGMIAFIVPGVIIALMLLVALPAFVLEDLGPIESLKRSAHLTKGNRWRLFGMGLLLMLAAWVIAFVMFGAIATSSKVVIGIAVLLAVIAAIVIVGVALTLPTVVFLQLRQLHEPGAATPGV